MRDYLKGSDYGYNEDLDIKDAVNTAFMRITNGPHGKVREQVFLKTSFGKILIHVVYEKNVSPHKRVFVYSESQAPVNDFTAHYFQDGFDGYIQLKFHTSAKKNMMKYKELIYYFLIYGLSISMYHYIKAEIRKKSDATRSLPIKFDGATLALNLAMSFNAVYHDDEAFGNFTKNKLEDQLISSSMDPLRIVLSTQRLITKETISEILQKRFVTAEHYKYTEQDVHIFDYEIGGKINSFYYKMILFIIETTVPESYRKNLLTAKSYKECSEKICLSDVDFIIKWVCGSLKDAIEKK